MEGERHEEVSFVEATTWGKLATVCAEHLGKGRGVRVVGRLKQERWEDGDGNPRAKVVIVAERRVPAEAARCRLRPGVHRRPGPAGRRAGVVERPPASGSRRGQRRQAHPPGSRRRPHFESTPRQPAQVRLTVAAPSNAKQQIFLVDPTLQHATTPALRHAAV